MYLTQFEINPVRRGARSLLSSPQRMHAAVLAAFTAEEREPTDAGRILWRVDQRGTQTLLYLASPHRPDLTHLVEQAGWPTKTTWRSGDYQRLLDRLIAGEQWAFRLTANPVHSGRKEGAGRSQRFGHVTAAQQHGWLTGRAERHGFAIVTGDHKEPDLIVRDRKIVRFARQGRQVSIATATFEGRLTVTDPDALRNALTRGIGPAKGYGCGLLTLAR
ncbi:type I-E CRISPR-associated protein Cas6/Cse3/CasE [Actinophytocola xinjiangensis]|uniref:Type I-E CRISPR-associated protein Cas6/Cse3/CasE n=1 Tax=Actinophytocola xinjiangensis TaxID=485602 RepID=A0A7Z0WKT9_9PSEU|nr:type I-E CRISPR-associated protein Cas6/Cse3/CasE [Actinophytocola xinjiangensis]OLF09064.1 type I-E CRISPR-associated protein Cas6/Cse3/CasE [Actinophytocola xinjiangensis]